MTKTISYWYSDYRLTAGVPRRILARARSAEDLWADYTIAPAGRRIERGVQYIDGTRGWEQIGPVQLVQP
jgi:hypothetical protein